MSEATGPVGENRKNEGHILILGYGNVDRGDDGLGHHVVNGLARRFGRGAVEPYLDEPETAAGNVDLIFQRQLTPEMAELLTDYDLVVFVDAHTGAFAEELRVAEVVAAYQPQALTHHLSPETLLALTQTMYGHSPTGLLYSGRGYAFDFTNELSDRTRALADQIIERILVLIGEGGGTP